MQDIKRLMVLAHSAQTSEMWESVATNAIFEALDDPDLAVGKRGLTTLHGAYKEALPSEEFVKSRVKSDHVKGKGHICSTTDKNGNLNRKVEGLCDLLKQQENSHKHS